MASFDTRASDLVSNQPDADRLTKAASSLPLPVPPDLKQPLGSESATHSYRLGELPDGQTELLEKSTTGSLSEIENDKTVISQRPVAAPQEFYRQMPLADLAEILEGRVLDHFAVQQMIGGGGMGAVFRGLDQRLNRDVAIKVMPGSRRDPEALRRFRLEAQAAARLDHPNIARVFYVGEAEQWNYIVFEFIDGVNIRDLVDMQGPLTVDDAVYFTRQVAEALQHAHERGVVHRDIKPSNILVTAAGTAKLVDMGLARDTSSEKSTGDQTASGVTLGTFDYISPEQARNPRDADVRSDLYSLGCSLFYMLTGHPPFPEGTALQKLLNHGSLPPPDPRGWRDDLSDQLVQILMKLMAKRPGDRYQKPVELVNDLQLLAELEDLPRSQGPTTLSLSTTIAQPTLLEANLPWLVAVAFLLGSTLWLQAQSSSKSFALPSINYPAVDGRSDDAISGSQHEGPDVRQPQTATSLPELFRPSEPSGFSPTSQDSDSLPTASAQPTTRSNDEIPSHDLQSAQQPMSPNTELAAAKSNDASVAGQAPTDNDQTSSVRPGPQSLVVSSVPPSDVAAQYWESSLYRAIRRLNDQSVPGVIEVRGSIWLDRPLVIQNRSEVTIRAGQGEPAKIEIARGLWSGATAESSAIYLSDSKLTLKGIQLHAALTETAATHRTIIQVSGSSSLDMRQCESTITGERSDLVHLVGVGDRSDGSGLLSDSSVLTGGSLTLTLQNCFVKGTGGVFAIRQSSPTTTESVQISVADSIFAVAGRVMDLSAATGRNGTERVVRFFCDRSTFVAAAGFAKIEHLGMGIPLVGLSRTSQACVFWSQPDVPHLAILGESVALQSNPDIVLLQGLNNAYDQSTDKLCEIYSGGSRTQELSFQDGQQQSWFVERGNERVVHWQKSIPTYQGYAEASIEEFLLVHSHFVPGFRTESSQ